MWDKVVFLGLLTAAFCEAKTNGSEILRCPDDKKVEELILRTTVVDAHTVRAKACILCKRYNHHICSLARDLHFDDVLDAPMHKMSLGFKCKDEQSEHNQTLLNLHALGYIGQSFIPHPVDVYCNYTSSLKVVDNTCLESAKLAEKLDGFHDVHDSKDNKTNAVIAFLVFCLLVMALVFVGSHLKRRSDGSSPVLPDFKQMISNVFKRKSSQSLES